MNNIFDVIQKLYSNLINVITVGFEEKDKKFVENEYMRILKNRYSELDISIDDYDKLYEYLFKIEYKEWNDLSLDVKKHILLKDVALDEIIDITNSAFKFANERLNKNILIPIAQADEYISKLEVLYNSVKEYNQQLAEWHISEGIMDLKYSSGQTENMSLRTSHIAK